MKCHHYRPFPGLIFTARLDCSPAGPAPAPRPCPPALAAAWAASSGAARPADRVTWARSRRSENYNVQHLVINGHYCRFSLSSLLTNILSRQFTATLSCPSSMPPASCPASSGTTPIPTTWSAPASSTRRSLSPRLGGWWCSAGQTGS